MLEEFSDVIFKVFVVVRVPQGLVDLGVEASVLGFGILNF